MKSFLVAFLKFLDHFITFLLVFITFEPILDGFWRFWTNPEIQDGTVDQDGRHSGMITQYAYVTSKSRSDSFYILGDTGGRGGRGAESPRL